MSTWSQRVLAELGKQKRNTEGGLSSHRWGLGWGWSQAERYAVPGLTLKGLMEMAVPLCTHSARSEVDMVESLQLCAL